MQNPSQKLNLHKIKRLDLESWHEWDYKKGTLRTTYPGLINICPVFNRDGQYYCRVSNTYWFEIDGHACFMPNEGKQFMWTFVHLHHKRLRAIELQAIYTLITQRMCPESLKDKYKKEKYIREIRDIYTGSRRHWTQVLKKLQASKT